MYPQIEINLSAIEENARKVVNLGKSNGVNIAGITKGVCGDTEVAKIMISSGIKILGDSRIDNIKKMQNAGIKAKYMLIREPMPSECEDVVKFSDYSINAEIETLRKLSFWAKKWGKVHKVIIIIDVGDRREGILPSQLELFLEKAENIEGIEIVGVATNVGCFGGVLPTYENQSLLVEMARKTEKILKKNLEIISTGGTVVLQLVQQEKFPEGINQIRVGEAILLGTSTTDDRVIPWLRQDTFTIKAEVIEVQRKPSLPEGPRGLSATGHKLHFENRGIRKRAIVALGTQDVEVHGLQPKDPEIEVLGGSSDHLVLDVGNSEIDVGDVISFSLRRPFQYITMLRAMSSPYVEKKYVR